MRSLQLCLTICTSTEICNNEKDLQVIIVHIVLILVQTFLQKNLRSYKCIEYMLYLICLFFICLNKPLIYCIIHLIIRDNVSKWTFKFFFKKNTKFFCKPVQYV